VLLSINFYILITVYKIIKYETKIDSLFILLLVSIWYTNAWGRENIRWPQQITTNISLLSFLLLFYAIRKGGNHLHFLILLLTTIGIFSTSWSFAYIPLIMGAIADMKISGRKKIELIVSLLLPSLLGLLYIIEGMESFSRNANYINIFFMMILAPFYAFVAWGPWGSIDFLFIGNFISKVFVAAWLILLMKKYSNYFGFKIEKSKQNTIIGFSASIFTFVLAIGVGRSSESLLIPLSSRFAFILTLLLLFIGFLVFSTGLSEVSNFRSIKFSLCLLLVMQILLLDRNLKVDVNLEKWEKIEFNRIVGLKARNAVIPRSCCNMDPGVDRHTYYKMLSLNQEK
jgi:hypothetical protein